jgi:hypothetical protein
MASLRKRYRESVDNKDAPPVQTAPSGVVERQSPVTDNQEPAEAPERPAESEAVRKAEQDAIKQRIAEMDRAEGLVRENVQRQPQFATERPKPQQAPAMPAHVQVWIDSHPEYFRDHVKHAELALATAKCTRDGLGWDNADFVPTVERYLGLRQEARPNSNGHDRSPPISAPTPPPRNSAPVRQQQRGPQVSAPPSRDGTPSWSSGRPMNSQAPLSGAEREMARASGISEDEYFRQREKMRKLQAAGIIQDGNR